MVSGILNIIKIIATADVWILCIEMQFFSSDWMIWCLSLVSGYDGALSPF